MRYDCEGILATIDWAHATLKDFCAKSGYAMDKIMAGSLQRFRGNPQLSRGHFARYLRGENCPSWLTANDLQMSSDLPMARLLLPLYDILRIGMVDYREYEGEQNVQNALLDVERRFQRRLTRYEEHGATLFNPRATPRYGLDICAYGSSHALAVLLGASMEFQVLYEGEIADELSAASRSKRISHQNDPLLMGQRAFQCLVLAIAAGEFPVTSALVVARVRQRVLDQLCFRDNVLDTGAINLTNAIRIGQEALRQASAEGRTPSQQRARLRVWLNDRTNPDLLQITPPIATPEQAAASRARKPTLLQLDAPVLGRHSHRHQLGKKARALLASALDGYVV